MKAKYYILSLLLFFFVLSLLTVAINYFVDPYLMLGSPRHEGFNYYKVDINGNIRLSKIYRPLFSTQDTLLVGNSRVGMGLDPEHACLTQSGAQAYNLGVPGAGVHQQLEFALNIIYQQAINRVFLGVDFGDFIVPLGQPARFFDPDSPAGSLRYNFSGKTNPEFASNIFLDHYRALFSLDALFSSARTVMLQSRTGPDQTDRGLNPARDMADAVATKGPHTLFTQKMYKLQKKYSKNSSLHYADGSPSLSFEALESFLKIAEDKGIQVILFTNPFHQTFWDLLRRNGLYQLHQIWLGEIKTIAARTQGADTQLWNFSADSPFIHERIPAASVKSAPLNWFWEAAHYRRQLGDLMLHNMLADTCGPAELFGARLL